MEVSRRILEEYENGQDYYDWHGKQLSQRPTRKEEHPSSSYLDWYSERVYKWELW